LKTIQNPRRSGYREIEHTADWELEVWAPDLAELLEQAAHGMYALSGIQLKDSPLQERLLEIIAEDAESLLVSFLTELIYYFEQELIGFDTFRLDLNGFQLKAQLSGAELEIIEKEIKAVTYHRLQVRSSEHGLSVNIVFDV
jgi:SHS2 domain-containing protein